MKLLENRWMRFYTESIIPHSLMILINIKMYWAKLNVVFVAETQTCSAKYIIIYINSIISQHNMILIEKSGMMRWCAVYQSMWGL